MPYLQESVAFDAQSGAADGLGGRTKSWTEIHQCRAEFIYTGGGEDVAAARFAGRQVLKVKIRSCVAAQAINVGARMRDVRRVTEWNIREVDAVTQRGWIYLVVEGERVT